MATTTISTKFQIVIPKEVREKLRLSPHQRLQIVEKGGIITLVRLKGASKACRRQASERRMIACEDLTGL